MVDKPDSDFITVIPQDTKLTAQMLQAGFLLGEVMVLPEKGFVVVQGEYRHVSAKALEVLLQLALHAEEVVSQEHLLEAVWGDAAAAKGNIVHAISELRHALSDHKECPVYIQTLVRRGYRLLLPVTLLPPTVQPAAPPLVERRGRGINGKQHWSWLVSLLRGSRLFSVSVAFLVSVWLFIQVMAITFPLLNISNKGMKFTLLLLLIGFPIVLIITWVGDLRERKRRLALSDNPNKQKYWRRQLGVDVGFLLLSFSAVLLLGRSVKLAIDADAEMSNPVLATPVEIAAPIANSVAVLPFSQARGSELADYLLTGIRHELLYSLTQLNQFPVMADRGMQGLALDVSYQQLAEQLRVEYVVEGQMRLAGEQLQLEVSLVETATGMQRWSARIVEARQALPALQRELHRQVQNALVLILPQVGVSLTTTDYQMTSSFKAFDAYMQAQQQIKLYDDLASLELAEKLLLQALQEDADFALASASLCKVHLDKYVISRSVTEFELANSACQHAASLKVNQAEVYAALGDLYRIRGEYPAAIAQYEKALSINARWVDALTGKAMALTAAAEPMEAEKLFTLAIELEPGYWQNYMHYGSFLYSSGNFIAAARRFERAAQLKPDSTEVLNSLAAAWFFSGQFDKARQVWQQVITLSPVPLSFSNLGTAHYFLGQYTEAEAFYREALDISPDDYIIWTNLADVLDVQPQRRQEALSFYRKALQLAEQNLAVDAQAAGLLSQISRLQAELQNCEQALVTEQQSLQQPSTDFYLYYDLAIASFNCERFTAGDEYISQAIRYGYPTTLLAADPKLPHAAQ